MPESITLLTLFLIRRNVSYLAAIFFLIQILHESLRNAVADVSLDTQTDSGHFRLVLYVSQLVTDP